MAIWIREHDNPMDLGLDYFETNPYCIYIYT